MVATLYDPQQLQVRADVRLEDVPNVLPGQKVQVETASASSPLEGEVLFTTSTANIQKNTLETKIAILNPPPTIRPEMLAKVTFLARDEGQRVDAIANGADSRSSNADRRRGGQRHHLGG